VAAKRVTEEPAYVLHRYDWSESSLILEVFTRHHGRIALVAKGAKRPSSSFRPVLLPLQPLHLSFGGDGEIRTLKGAEWVGGHVMPTGDALLSGYYLNELLLRLLARDDPHPGLFDAYASVVQVLAGHGSPTGIGPALEGEVLHVALRAFELLLLREIGNLPDFTHCVRCETEATASRGSKFWVTASGLICEACGRPEFEHAAIQPGSVRLLQQLSADEAPVFAELAPPVTQMKEVRRIVTAAVTHSLDRKPKMLGYLKF